MGPTLFRHMRDYVGKVRPAVADFDPEIHGGDDSPVFLRYTGKQFTSSDVSNILSAEVRRPRLSCTLIRKTTTTMVRNLYDIFSKRKKHLLPL